MPPTSAAVSAGGTAADKAPASREVSRVLVEEGCNPQLAVGNVLDDDDGDALGIDSFDGPFNVLKHGIRVPQGELAVWKAVVLEINHQQCFVMEMPPFNTVR